MIGVSTDVEIPHICPEGMDKFESSIGSLIMSLSMTKLAEKIWRPKRKRAIGPRLVVR
jgi:hypothetical protein